MRDLPLACSLDAPALEERLAEMRALARDSLIAADSSGVLRFRATPESRARLERIVAAEAECCAFLALDLREHDGELRLTITAPEGAEPVAAIHRAVAVTAEPLDWRIAGHHYVAAGDFEGEGGTVAGDVVSTDGLPIAGATVALLGVAELRTDEVGGFRFERVEPGTHRLQAVALGYQSHQQSVTVRAGETTGATVQLEPLASTDPYHEVVILAGHVCAQTYVLLTTINYGNLACGGEGSTIAGKLDVAEAIHHPATHATTPAAGTPIAVTNPTPARRPVIGKGRSLRYRRDPRPGLSRPVTAAHPRSSPAAPRRTGPAARPPTGHTAQTARFPA